MQTTTRRRLAMSAALMGVAALSGAQTIFDNIQGYTGWNTTTWTEVRGALNTPRIVGMQFEASSTAFATSMDLSIQAQLAGSVGGTVNLFADSGSNTLGTFMHSVSFPTQPVLGSTGHVTVALPNLLMTSGQKYWAVTNADGLFGMLFWHIPPSSTFGNMYTTASAASPGTYSQERQPGLRITGDPVPEPATLVALGMGAAALLRRRLRRA